MKKSFALSLALVLVLVIHMTCAQADPEDFKDRIMPDFSVSTIDGNTFTLSDSLKTHNLVLINLWATWCGPCCVEFPYLETAWEQYSDRVDVIAMSVEESDTFETLRSFAGDNGLHFPIGRDETDLFGRMGGSAIPTTLIVDKERRVVSVEIGSKGSVEEFTSLFDSLLSSANPAPAQGRNTNRCVLCFRDTNGNPIPGVSIAFCNGEYTAVETDSNGRVSFDGDPNEYHVHLLAVPNGFAKPWEELSVSGGEYDLTVTLYSAT